MNAPDRNVAQILLRRGRFQGPADGAKWAHSPPGLAHQGRAALRTDGGRSHLWGATRSQALWQVEFPKTGTIPYARRSEGKAGHVPPDERRSGRVGRSADNRTGILSSVGSGMLPRLVLKESTPKVATRVRAPSGEGSRRIEAGPEWSFIHHSEGLLCTLIILPAPRTTRSTRIRRPDLRRGFG